MQERVLFVALILICAYLLKRFRIFGEEDARGFINYVIYFSLPALVFKEVRGLEVSGETVGVVLTAWSVILMSLVLSWLVGKSLRMDPRTLRSFVLVSSFGNTAFLGYPFTYALFGEEGLGFAVLYDQMGSFLLVMSVGFLIAKGEFSVREVITFPPFLSLVLGVLMRGANLPPAIEVFLEVVGGSLIPAVLFALGLRFSPLNLLRSIKPVLLSLGIKMVLVPGVLLLVLKLASLKTLGYKVALLESSMPPMVMAGVLAVRYGLNEEVALSSITLGMILSFIIVPLWVSLL
jgi:auxin efflux carrier (AEC)